jgi:solute carrier family 10 (sodium/bile acid cotransporter), member 7
VVWLTRFISLSLKACIALPIRGGFRAAWIRSNRFIFGLFGVVILAFLFPRPGARDGWLHPDLISDFGIALILFLQGLSMPLEKVRRGAGNWRLHVIIQVFTFEV